MAILSKQQIESLNTTMAALERAARLIQAANAAVDSTGLTSVFKVTLAPIGLAYSAAERTLEENRMAARRAGVRVAA